VGSSSLDGDSLSRVGSIVQSQESLNRQVEGKRSHGTGPEIEEAGASSAVIPPLPFCERLPVYSTCHYFHLGVVISTNMSKCNRIQQRFKKCDHTVNFYKFCSGTHANKHADRETCYNLKTGAAPTTERPPSLSGSCPHCLAAQAGWDCCECGKPVPKDTNDCPRCDKAFCLDCSTGEN
jgi:hypothetical protein